MLAIWRACVSFFPRKKAYRSLLFSLSPLQNHIFFFNLQISLHSSLTPNNKNASHRRKTLVAIPPFLASPQIAPPMRRRNRQFLPQCNSPNPNSHTYAFSSLSIPVVNRFLAVRLQVNKFGTDENRPDPEAVKPKWNPKGKIRDSFLSHCLFFVVVSFDF